jgi:hypothetical protein
VTYEEARELVTLAMVAKGLPPPDFSSAAPYKNRSDPLGCVLYALSPARSENTYMYSGLIDNTGYIERNIEAFLRGDTKADWRYL